MSLENNFLYVLSDNHINRNKFDSEKWEFTKENIEESFWIIIDDMKKTLKKNKKSKFFLLFWWDTFDKFESTSDFKKWEFWFVDSLKNFFWKEKIEIIIITWNHDCNNVSEYTAISWFNKYWTEIWSKLICEENELVNYSTGDIDFILAPFPFLHKNRKNWDYLKLISKLKKKNNWEKFQLLLSHFIIDWIKSWKHWWLSYRNVHSNQKELENLWFNLILLWDNHVHYDENWIISIWSSEQVSFSEEWDQKHILKISFNKEKEYFIDYLILNEASNKKKTLYISTKEIWNLENKELENEISNIISLELKKKWDLNKKDIRVRIEIKYEHQDKISFIRKLLSEIKKNSISYFEEFEILDKADLNQLDEINISELTNEELLVKQYSKKIFLTNDEKFHNWILDRKDLIHWKKDLILEKIYSQMNKL